MASTPVITGFARILHACLEKKGSCTTPHRLLPTHKNIKLPLHQIIRDFEEGTARWLAPAENSQMEMTTPNRSFSLAFGRPPDSKDIEDLCCPEDPPGAHD
jgi:hypothetical protein